MFLIKTREQISETKSSGGRMRDAAGQAVPLTRKAGSSAYQSAKRGVIGARGWAAPRLENAAETVTSSLAPRVSAALQTTAARVRPAEPEPKRTGLRRFMSWRWMLGIVAGILAAGAAGFGAMTMQRRYMNATADAKDAAEMTEEEMNAQARAADGTAVPPQGTPNSRFTPTGR